jgi:hypothetical protein
MLVYLMDKRFVKGRLSFTYFRLDDAVRHVDVHRDKASIRVTAMLRRYYEYLNVLTCYIA